MGKMQNSAKVLKNGGALTNCVNNCSFLLIVKLDFEW